MADARSVVVKFLGDARGLKSSTDDAARGVDKFKSKVKVAAAAVAGAVIAGGVALAKLGGDFQAAFGGIIAATGASGDALKGLEKDFKTVLASGPESFDDVSVAIGELNTRLGTTGKPLQDMSRQMLDLARITGSDVKTTISNATRVFGDWGVETKDQAATLDLLFQSTKQSGIGLGRLTDLTVQFGAPLRQFNFSLADSAALFGKWEKEGVNTQIVLSGMKAALGKFSKAGKEPRAELDRYSKAIKNAGTAGEANAIAIEAFGQRAGPDMAAAIREGKFEIDDYVKDLRNSKGAVQDVSDRTKTFEQKLQELKNRGFVALEPIATKFYELTLKAADTLESASEWASKHSKIMKVLGITIGVVAAVVLTAGAAIKAYEIAVKVARAATLVWNAAMWLLNAAFLANPIVGVTLIIAALVVGIVIAYKKVGWFRDGVNALWGAIKNVFGWVRDNWKNILTFLTGPIGIAVRLISKHWDSIKAGARKMKDGIVGIFKGVSNAITAPIRGAVDAIRSAWNNTLGGKGFDGISIPFAPDLPGFRIPMLAQGGTIARRGWTMVGEAGPELLNLGRGAQVRPLDNPPSAGPDVLELTLDLGRGIQEVISINLREHDRGLKRTRMAGGMRTV